MPTVEEIDLIFRAWRSSELCKKVWQLSEFGIIAPIFLRTRYGPKNDKMMEEGISAFEETTINNYRKLIFGIAPRPIDFISTVDSKC
ncbi:hypothetical protein PDE_07058 [Penicillium oxalicum 114-2]|uniref:Uncharacterized protein n=1 Tax=Penicillium oxalicum (strain 114-2 / CGMCC 5302) TaxID=933388 RepID=S7ZNY7_PENO1|nr:hypothetical protein PDE_07058 [Penicillium oxalicum 114-2]